MTRQGNMKASLCQLTTVLCLAVWVPFAAAEVVEEETWYNAEGEVVKTVKRTYTGADARRTADWEPAWVIRERSRGLYTSGRRYYSPRRYAGYGSYFGGGYYYSPAIGYSYGRRCGSGYRGGFTGYYTKVGGKSHWGIGYRAPGLSIHYRR